MKYTILKKNGSTENFEPNKIKVAIRKSANRIGVTLDDDTCDRIVEQIKENMVHPQITVAEMHKLVCRVLKRIAPDVAMSYQNYRDYKTTYAEDFDKLFQQTKDVLYLGDRENANFDSALISTKGSLIRGYLTKSLYQKFYLTKRELEATRRGDIYIHDMRDMLMGSYNCCLFDVGEVLKGGFTMANVEYHEPNSVLSALQVIGDVTLSASAQQSTWVVVKPCERLTNGVII